MARASGAGDYIATALEPSFPTIHLVPLASGRQRLGNRARLTSIALSFRRAGSTGPQSVSVTAAPSALSAQLFHAGADCLEIVSSSGMSHVSFPVGLVERSSPRPLS